jgi:hypothetical protein
MVAQNSMNFRHLRTAKFFTAIYSLASVELAKSTAHQEHHKLQADSRSLKPCKSAI